MPIPPIPISGMRCHASSTSEPGRVPVRPRGPDTGLGMRPTERTYTHPVVGINAPGDGAGTTRQHKSREIGALFAPTPAIPVRRTWTLHAPPLPRAGAGHVHHAQSSGNRGRTAGKDRACQNRWLYRNAEGSRRALKSLCHAELSCGRAPLDDGRCAHCTRSDGRVTADTQPL